jgi:hypothetical protein
MIWFCCEESRGVIDHFAKESRGPEKFLTQGPMQNRASIRGRRA